MSNLYTSRQVVKGLTKKPRSRLFWDAFLVLFCLVLGSISLIYFLMILLFFFVFGLIEQYENRNYHKKRSRW